MTLRFGSLFAGAGGFDIGFDAAGFAPAWQVEIDRTARDVLARHWPDVPRHPDVRGVGKANLAPVDVVVGGFPCQDVSTAGKRAGFEGGARSSLWYEMLRVVHELQPAYVVWENVPGLLSADDGRAFGWVLRGLADLGFDGGWRTVDAQFFGVPQQRRRVFGVFARGHSGADRACEILALAEGGRRRTPKGRKAGQGVAACLTRGSGSGGVNPPGRRQEDDINLIAGTLAFCELGEGHATYQETETATALRTNTGGGSQVANLAVYGGGSGAGERRGNAALTCPTGTGRIDFDSENFVLVPAVCATGTVAHTLTGEGHDASEDGTGRGTPIVAFNWNASHAAESDRLCPNSRAQAECGSGMPAAHVGSVVRRLMPVECERLMGWPDDWTRWRADGREIADGPRYRLCGNGVVGTVSKWLAVRLAAVAAGGGA